MPACVLRLSYGCCSRETERGERFCPVPSKRPAVLREERSGEETPALWLRAASALVALPCWGHSRRDTFQKEKRSDIEGGYAN